MLERDAEWEADGFQRNFGHFKYVYKTSLRCLGSWNPFLLLSSPILFGPLVQPDWSGCYLLAVVLFYMHLGQVDPVLWSSWESYHTI